MSKPIVLIAFCSGDLIHADFAMSCLMMENHLRDNGTHFGFANFKTSLISVGRNSLAQGAIDTDATHVLQLDSDIVFPSTTLNRLLAHNLDIVGASYLGRHSPRRMNHMLLDGSIQVPQLTGVSEVNYVATGCLLVKTDVFKRVPFPWFDVKHLAPNGPNNYIGEDVFFCQKAREYGEKVFVDWDLSHTIRHLGLLPLDPSMKEV